MDITDAQLQKILEAIQSLKSPGGFQWMQALPIFLSSFLGILTAVGLERFRRRLDMSKANEDRRKRELQQINGVVIGIGYNVEVLLHSVGQNVLPHFLQSHSAYDALLLAIHAEEDTLRAFMFDLSDRYPALGMTGPAQSFLEADFLEKLPFLIEKDPELVKQSGWMMRYCRMFQSAINDRNRQVEVATISAQQGVLTVSQLRSIIQIQCATSIAECVNAYELFKHFPSIAASLQRIAIADYTGVGKISTLHLPVGLAPIIEQLRPIHEHAAANMPGGPIPPPPAQQAP